MTTRTNRISEENKREMAMAVRAEGRDPIAERRARLAEIDTRPETLAEETRDPLDAARGLLVALALTAAVALCVAGGYGLYRWLYPWQ